MEEYQRVTPTAHDEHGDSLGELSYSDQPRHSTTLDFERSSSHDAPSPRRQRDRHDRTDSRGSYTSVISDSGLISDDEHTMQDVEDEEGTRIADMYLDEHEGEKSPLHLSLDAEDDDKELHSARSTSSFPPNRTSASILFGSEDSDDDDEYEEQLKRYSLDFRQSSSTSSTTSKNNSLWCKIQQARQKARQRRAEYLLQQSERQTWRQSVYLFLVMTLCDATDTGIALVAIGLLAWFIMLWKLPSNRSLIFWGGLVVWSIRLGARPVRDCFIQRRVRMHQQERERRRTYSAGYEVGHGMIASSPSASVSQFEDSSGDLSFAHPPSMELSAVSDRGAARNVVDGRSSTGGSENQSSYIPHFLI